MTLEDAASHLPELIREARAGQHIVLTQGHQPVAALVPLDDDGPSATELARLAMAGGTFDWLADEPDLYDDTCGEEIRPEVARVSTLLRQWQQKFGLPQCPDGQAQTPVQALFATWAEEDARLTPKEVAAEQRS